MPDETVIKIETPEPAPVETVVAASAPDALLVEPVVDMATRLGEVCTKMEVLESALAAIVAENVQLKTDMQFIRDELNVVRALATPEPEPEPIIEETPESDLPVETLEEIEIIPEVTPEVVEEVKKRKRFFV